MEGKNAGDIIKKLLEQHPPQGRLQDQGRRIKAEESTCSGHWSEFKP